MRHLSLAVSTRARVALSIFVALWAQGCGSEGATVPGASMDAAAAPADGPVDGPGTAPDAGADVDVDAGPAPAPPPSIAAISPDVASEGSEIRISGEGFGPGARVRIRGTEATTVAVAADGRSLVAIVPDLPEVLPGPPVPSRVEVEMPNTQEPERPHVAAFNGRFLVRGI